MEKGFKNLQQAHRAAQKKNSTSDTHYDSGISFSEDEADDHHSEMPSIPEENIPQQQHHSQQQNPVPPPNFVDRQSSFPQNIPQNGLAIPSIASMLSPYPSCNNRIRK